MPVFFLLLFILSCSPEAKSNNLSIHVLDVGEGQAVLLSKDHHAVLIDTGHAGQALSVLKRMQQLEIESLDYLILTHLHPDHASGYFRIHEAYPAAVVADNCHVIKPTTTPDMVRWVDKALQLNPARRCLSAGDFIHWQGVEIKVLWPGLQATTADNLNDASLVLQITSNGRRLLLMGDVGVKVETELIKNGQLLPVDILLAGHHGSDKSTSEKLLDVVTPNRVVISTNKNNMRGYPAKSTLNRLKKYTGLIYRTDQQGEIVFNMK